MQNILLRLMYFTIPAVFSINLLEQFSMAPMITILSDPEPYLGNQSTEYSLTILSSVNRLLPLELDRLFHQVCQVWTFFTGEPLN